MRISINNISGTNIGTSSRAAVAQTDIYPACNIQAIFIDYRASSAQVRVVLTTDGTFYLYESIGVTSGNNAIRGMLIIPYNFEN